MTNPMDKPRVCAFDEEENKTLALDPEGESCSPLSEGDGDFCYGCNNYVCEVHSRNLSLVHGHTVEEHAEYED